MIRCDAMAAIKWMAMVFAMLMVQNKINAQPTSLLTKEIIFDHLPLELGLSQNTINCMLQDKQGYLWIGTWSGLIRYDGYSTVLYHSGNKPGKIKSDKITAIFEDHNEVLWVGTQMAGLFKFDRSSEQFIQYKNNPQDPTTLSNNNIWCIQEDRDNILWVGTQNGLNALNPATDKFTTFITVANQKNTISNNHITDLHLSSRGDLWVATTFGLNKLYKSPQNKFAFERFIYTENGKQLEVDNYIIKLDELNSDGNSSIWFGTSRGLKKFENGKFQNFLMQDKPSSYSALLSLIVVEGPKPYLVAGSEKGLNFFDPAENKFSRFLPGVEERINLSHAAITSLYLDRGGVLWAGTKKGLNKFDCYSKNFEAYKTATFDKSRGIITGIQGAGNNAYWLSTLGGGLFQFADKQFSRISIYDPKENDLINYVQTMHAGANGNVWLGTAGTGIYHFNQKDVDHSGTVKKFDHYTVSTSPAISADFIMSVHEASDGDVWVGTWESGLNKITSKKEVIIYGDSLLKIVPLVVIYEDKEHNIWVGTRGNGLYKITENGTALKIKKWNSSDKSANRLTNNFINSICQDHNGLFWIGTEGGLFSFNPSQEKFVPFKFKDQSKIDGIATVQNDNAGKLWLAQENGLTVIDPEDASYVKRYDYHDRIQGGFFYNNVSFKDAAGNLFFGGSEGFNVIQPDVVLQNPNVPKVTINSLQIFGKEILLAKNLPDYGKADLPLKDSIALVFDDKQNSFSFEFTALDYAAPEKIRYAYMLQGFDSQWKFTNSSRRLAVYTNLSEGNYIFKVKAANSDGIWSSEINQLAFVINPPWWKTFWALIIYSFFGLIALLVFRKIILMQANLKHDLKLERLQRENMEKLNQAKLQFFTNISHEFRTPLTLILGPAQSLLDSNDRGQKERDQLLIINNNANRLLRLVNQLLDFRKVESGNLKLEVSQRNVVKFIREIKFSFEALAEILKIEFNFSSPSNCVKLWFDADQLEKIMFNLLSNAFKHTPEGGKISIIIKEDIDNVLIVVEDNGKGIKRQHFESIFQTFFSYDEDKHHTGTGIGLAFAKSLVDMHHGKLEFESELNKCTRFIVKLKKGFAHFDSSDIVSVSNEVDIPENNEKTLLQINALVPMESAEPELEDGLPKLLIVEDNYEVREYLKTVFGESYNIFMATNGEEGIAMAIDKMPHVIISDVMMPVMDGIKLCQHLKSNVKTSHIPVILLTARTSLVFKVEGLESGADDYITKPFNPNVLKLKVRNLIHSRQLMQHVFQDNAILNIEPKKVTITSIDEIFVQKALDGIELNMSNADYSVDDLGRDVGMSRTQLYRKLKALTGQSANEFIRTIRLKRAAQLLEQNQFTIAEVTHKVGFTDLQYFRDCFKKLFGSIPSEYISNHKVEDFKKKN